MYIQVDRTSPAPPYRQIEEALRGLIERGALVPGSRLPSTRGLAAVTGVNRLTVHKAFQQLEADGFIVTKVGSGTFVRVRSSRPLLESAAPRESIEDSARRVWGPLFVNPRLSTPSLPAMAYSRGSGGASFVYAAPPGDIFPVEEFRQCTNYVLKRRGAEVYRVGAAASGLSSLKEYLIGWLAQDNIVATERTLVITTGCQQTLDLTRKLLVGPDDSMLLENPSFPGAVGALSPSGTGLMPLPVHRDAPHLDSETLVGHQNRCKLIYVTPNFHNPTGLTMPLPRRQQLADLALQHSIPLIEDDVFGALRYEGAVQPSLQSLCPRMVIHVGSFSKMLNPSLRLGWMVAPEPFAEQIAIAKQASDLHTSTLVQTAMDEFCRRGLMVRHLKRVRRIFKARRDAMAQALSRYFPRDAQWSLPEGGLSIWVTLPDEMNTQDLLALAQDKGVQFLPGAIFYFAAPKHNCMRLSFATESEGVIDAGIQILGEIIAKRRLRLIRPGAWQDRRAVI
jgi:GntR family transcriptional regulator/MocR family aminotransferase